jgi:hypothetical protein
MNISVKKIKTSELKPGDLFSMLDEWYWDKFLSDKHIVGHKVYIRTDNPCESPDYDPEQPVYLITINQNLSQVA